jgi:GNAT superfamily N-acetyltransferase
MKVSAIVEALERNTLPTLYCLQKGDTLTNEEIHAFSSINREWIEAQFCLFERDIAMLSDPTSYFLKSGGFIFCLKIDNEIIGTAALLKEDNGFEFCKFAIKASQRGKGYGRYFFNKILAFIVEQSIEIVQIQCWANSTIANLIYLKNGS